MDGGPRPALDVATRPPDLAAHAQLVSPRTRAVTGGQAAACDSARDDAVSQCEATECYDRDQRKVRAFDCDPEPNACNWQSTWYGWYAEFTVHGD